MPPTNSWPGLTSDEADDAAVDLMLRLEPFIPPKPVFSDFSKPPPNQLSTASSLRVGYAAHLRAEKARKNAILQTAPALSSGKTRNKKVERAQTAPTSARIGPSPIGNLPVETLSTVLTYVTPDVLAILINICKYFRSLLTSEIHSKHLWRQARRNTLPRPLPDPPVGWEEQKWGRFVFAWGQCRICSRPTNRVWISITLTVKLCIDPTCGKKFVETLSCPSQLQNNRLRRHLPDHFWRAIPRVEDQSPLADHGLPASPTRLPALDRQLKAQSISFLAEQVQPIYDEATSDLINTESTVSQQSAITKWYGRAILQLTKQKWAAELIWWAAEHESHMRSIKKSNDKALRTEAKTHNWKKRDLYNSKTLMDVVHVATRSGETATAQLQQATTIRAADAEVSTLADRRQRREFAQTEQLIREQMADLHKYILRTHAGPVPSLKAFRKLRSVQTVALTGRVAISLSKSGAQSDRVATHVNADLTQWADFARHQFASLLPNEASFSNSAMPAVTAAQWTHPAQRVHALFLCVPCTQADAALRSRPKPKRLGPSTDWRALTCAEACRHVCPPAALHGKNNNKRTLDRRVDAPIYGFEYDELASKAVSAAALSANGNPTIIKPAELDGLGPVFRCGAPDCKVTMVFSRVRHHALRHTSIGIFDCLDGPGPAPGPAVLEDIFDENKKPKPEWAPADKRSFLCRHCDSQPFTARGIRQHVHDAHHVEYDGLAGEDFSRIVDLTPPISDLM
ncbi:hypothetical protein BKA62DRAFT_711598 [Auriculariales sp. MPI-PUGE-AT-0066]|nr:hypothetical protein BKA62DRAFT_711598 [Auriculariales sp. MPI-PUGE-AT-0066]